ncbi:MAG: transposase [Moorea sp. SIO1F2]|nr:transposase [Moorena sp. SIO3I7]NEO06845.1 transposase [Moorena sp. SIO3I8]NEO22310.1 transposase [Moorena sp. SIO4A5]NEP25503.1 transposase [Moorena sp. SIO3I6]NEQ58259.1 transposase [Moorena sp. SIO4A1]NET84201.1 transposase [Moorena sp. SIO1F2]
MNRKAYPTDLRDKQWVLIEPLLPAAKSVTGRGRKRTVIRGEIVNAILYWSRSGCAWELLPHDFPPPKTVYSSGLTCVSPVSMTYIDSDTNARYNAHTYTTTVILGMFQIFCENHCPIFPFLHTRRKAVNHSDAASYSWFYYQFTRGEL